MAYDTILADRIRAFLGKRRDLVEKRMFGGVGFMLRGNLLLGIWKNSLVVRLDPADWEAAAQEPHAEKFDVVGRPMKGWVLVQAEGIRDALGLGAWIERALDYVGSLPKKAKKPAKPKKGRPKK